MPANRAPGVITNIIPAGLTGLFGTVALLTGCAETTQPFPETLHTSSIPTIAAAKEKNWWQPTADQQLRWYWQLQGGIDTSHQVDVYNIDIDTPQDVIDTLKTRGVKLICYFSVGTVELFRPDAAEFPAAIVGDSYPGYDDERWLDISRYTAFSEVMTNRLNRCAEKGFDGVEGDNVDAFNHLLSTGHDNGISNNNSGSRELAQRESVDYVRWLAGESHKRGLAFGLKNAEAIAPHVINQVDWMITENCVVDDWCAEAVIFVEHNKPVFMTEYKELLSDFSVACEQAAKYRFSAIYRDVGLTANGVFEECLR